MKIIGRNAVLEAIKSKQTIDRLAVEKGLKDTSAQRLIDEAKSRGIKILFRDKQVMDRESENGRHQGFIAEITDFVYSEIDDILNLAAERDESPFIVILDGVEDPHNLGSVIRVAECAGVHGIIIPRHRSVSVNETVIKISSGAAAHMKIAKVTNISDTINELKKKNIWVYAADMQGDDLYKTDLKGAVAIVIGGEGDGVKSRVLKSCDASVKIPMKGEVSSLNASVAAGIIIYEKIRQSN